MANTILAFPNYADVGYYSPAFVDVLGQSGAPFSNMQNRFLAYKSRTRNCTPHESTILLDLATTRDVLVVAIPRHNLTFDATATVSVLDGNRGLVGSKTVEVYPQDVYPLETLTFEDARFWDGRIDVEDAQLFPMPLLCIFDTALVGRYVKIEISDTENPAGYLEFERLFVSPGWQPTYNFNYGSKIGTRDPTVVTTGLGGADFFDIREKRRQAALQFPYIPKNEGYANALGMFAKLGVSQQLFVCMDPDDLVNRHRHSFLATLESLSDLDIAAFGYVGTAFALKEVVA